MFEKLSSTTKKVKNHVVKHRTKYAVVATATATAAIALKLQFYTANQFNTFLEEKNLIEEYYALNEN